MTTIMDARKILNCLVIILWTTTIVGLSLLITGIYTSITPLVIVGSILIPSPCLVLTIFIFFLILRCVGITVLFSAYMCVATAVDEINEMLTCYQFNHYLFKFKEAYYKTPATIPPTPFKSTDSVSTLG